MIIEEKNVVVVRRPPKNESSSSNPKNPSKILHIFPCSSDDDCEEGSISAYYDVSIWLYVTLTFVYSYHLSKLVRGVQRERKITLLRGVSESSSDKVLPLGKRSR